MKITLNENEIKDAIVDRVRNSFSVKRHMKIDVDIVATRGSDGFTATVDITEDQEAIEEAKAKPTTGVRVIHDKTANANSSEAPKRRGRPRKVDQIAPAATLEAAQETTEKATEAEDQNTATKTVEAAEAAVQQPVEAEQGQAPNQEQEAEQTAQEQETDKPAPSAPAKSLFGGMSTPNNS